MNVYVVKSGSYDGNIGMTIWENIRVFSNYDTADKWVESEKKRQEKTFNENYDFYVIEELTLVQE
jgi:hypothetical protein